MNCLVCGKPFAPKSDREKICSQACRKLRATQRIREFYVRIPTKKCEFCVAPFKPRRKKTRFCSPKCAAAKKRGKQLHELNAYMERCRSRTHCKYGHELPPKIRGLVRRCSQCHRGKKKKYVSLCCKECKSPFTAPKDQSFCSPRCVAAHQRLDAFSCLHCHEEFAPERATQKFCSKNCAYTFRRLDKEEKRSRRLSSTRRYNKRASNIYYQIDSIKRMAAEIEAMITKTGQTGTTE